MSEKEILNAYTQKLNLDVKDLPNNYDPESFARSLMLGHVKQSPISYSNNTTSVSRNEALSHNAN